MEIGDIVEYENARWLAVGAQRLVKTIVLERTDGRRVEVPDTLDKDDPKALRVVAQPKTKWALLTAPTRSGAGPFVKILLPPMVGQRKTMELELLIDWAPSDTGREGGPFFVRPGTGILPGMILLAHHRSGAVVRVQVPKTFGTVSHKTALKAAKTQPKKADRDRFNRILRDDDD